jgi:hypothetical protein
VYCSRSTELAKEGRKSVVVAMKVAVETMIVPIEAAIVLVEAVGCE